MYVSKIDQGGDSVTSQAPLGCDLPCLVARPVLLWRDSIHVEIRL